MLVPAITHHSPVPATKYLLFPEGATKLYKTYHYCKTIDKEVVVRCGQKEITYKDVIWYGFLNMSSKEVDKVGLVDKYVSFAEAIEVFKPNLSCKLIGFSIRDQDWRDDILEFNWAEFGEIK